MSVAEIPPAAGAGEVVAEHRSGDGTPLLLLHGLTATWRVWRPVLPELERRHDVIAPTLAGHHGAAPLVEGVEVSVAALADVLEERMDELGLERAHVAGNSLGGWLALELGRRGRALSVVALSPAGAWSRERDLRRVVWLIRGGNRAAVKLGPRARRLVARPRLRRLVLRGMAEHGDRIPAAEAAAMLTDSAGCTVLDGFMAAVMRDGPIARGPQTPPCPVRIAWSGRDRTIPFARYGRPLLDLVPGAELVTLPGVGHVPMYDDPRLVARTILEVTTAADAARSPEPEGAQTP